MALMAWWFSALAKGDLDPGLVTLDPDELRIGGQGDAVLEPNARAPALEIVVSHDAPHLHHVGLGDVLLRVQKPLGEIAVVRREQDTARREVEATDRVHAP